MLKLSATSPQPTLPPRVRPSSSSFPTPPSAASGTGGADGDRHGFVVAFTPSGEKAWLAFLHLPSASGTATSAVAAVAVAATAAALTPRAPLEPPVGQDNVDVGSEAKDGDYSRDIGVYVVLNSVAAATSTLGTTLTVTGGGSPTTVTGLSGAAQVGQVFVAKLLATTGRPLYAFAPTAAAVSKVALSAAVEQTGGGLVIVGEFTPTTSGADFACATYVGTDVFNFGAAHDKALGCPLDCAAQTKSSCKLPAFDPSSVSGFVAMLRDGARDLATGRLIAVRDKGSVAWAKSFGEIHPSARVSGGLSGGLTRVERGGEGWLTRSGDCRRNVKFGYLCTRLSAAAD